MLRPSGDCYWHGVMTVAQGPEARKKVDGAERVCTSSLSRFILAGDPKW
jgi:hypothetical protein